MLDLVFSSLGMHAYCSKDYCIGYHSVKSPILNEYNAPPMYTFTDDPFDATFSKHHHSESYLHHSSQMETSCDEQIYSIPSLGSQPESDLQLAPIPDMKTHGNTPMIHLHGTEKMLQSSEEVPEITGQQAAPTLVHGDESHAVLVAPNMSVYQHSSSYSEDNTVTAEIMNTFLPDLVSAISDNVLSVSVQCLANGLISIQVYKRVLESGGTSKDRARTLLVAVQNSTETDSRCFEILLSILEQELPRASREKLLSKIRKEVTEKVNTCKAIGPSAQANQQLQLGELAKESALQQSSLLGRFEDSIRQHERACAEKKLLEERLKVKSEKCKTLKAELETLRGQNQEVTNTQSRISACTIQTENLRKRIEELQKTIEEQGIQAKRDRNTLISQTKNLFDRLVQQSQLEFQKREEELMEVFSKGEVLASKKKQSARKVQSKQGKVIGLDLSKSATPLQ